MLQRFTIITNAQNTLQHSQRGGASSPCYRERW